MAGIRYKGQIFSGSASTKSADEVSYDNSDSGLSATDVQGAVDEINSKFGISDNMILDFDNVNFFKNVFPGPNGIIFLPFRTSTANQPTTASWGFCIVYYGGANTDFEIFYVNTRGYAYLRNCAGGTFGNWTQV